MGFFGDLKQDLSQAVEELVPDELSALTEDTKAQQEPEPVAAEPVVSEESAPAEDAIDLEKMLEEALKENLPLYEDPEGEASGEIATEEVAEENAEEIAEEVSAVDDAFADIAAIAAQLQEQEQVEEIVPEEVQQEEVKMQEPEVTYARTTTTNKGADRIMDSYAADYEDDISVITKGMKVNGDVSTEGSMDLVGTVNGNLEVKGKLNVTGYITGNSTAREVFAENAKITGDVTSETSVKIGAGTVIIGNISANSAAIAGAVKGDIDVHGPVILDSTAIVMGNIRSKSVQINNGAAIEGLCSQCYADVSPTSFFDDYKPADTAKKSK